jgi:hypothetical protein
MARVGILDDAVSRQRERRDPLGRLPWWARLLGTVLLLALVTAQILLGSGASRVLGVVLLLVVVPAQLLGAYAAWKVSQQDRA